MRTKLLRLISVCLLLSICLSFLSSCHGARESVEFKIPENFNPDEEYNIVFWAKNENNSSQREVYEAAIAGFREHYPNINVTIKHYTDYGAIYNDVITNIQTGTTPNVCITYPDHIATYITGENVVVPLDDLVKDEKFGLSGSEVRFDSPTEEEIVGKFLDECYIGENLYAMPFMRSTEACYVNKTYVEKLGFELPEVLTWDFIWQVSKAALKKESFLDEKGKVQTVYSVNGQSVMIPVIYKSTDNMMIQMLRQLDAGYSTEAGQVQIFNDKTEEILGTVSEQVEKGAFSTFKISSYPGNYLNKGQCIFAIDSTAGATWMGADAPLMDVHHSTVADFETAVLPVPQFNPEKPEMISQGPSLCIFNKENPGEVMASWLFVQYLISNETQIAYSKTEGYLPVTEKAQSAEEYLDYLSRAGENNTTYYDVKIAATKLLMENIENSFTTPVFNGSTSLRNAAGELIERVAKSTRRGENINDEYFRELYADVTADYKLNQIERSGVKSRLGEMPALSIGLLSGLGAVWLGIGIYVLVPKIKKRAEEKSRGNIDK